MKVIAGLGNPGSKYDRTRHNIGFDVVAELARRLGADGIKKRFDADTVETRCGTEKVLLLCPQTYMNRSGQSVSAAMRFFKLEADDLLVVCDDMNLPLGRLRIKPGGSAGGQKGLADILRHLGDSAVPRLRVGIGRPPAVMQVTDYVLGRWTEDEQPGIAAAGHRAVEAALAWANHGIDRAMNDYNADPSGDP